MAGRPRFFLPVRVLSRLFRRLFVAALGQAYARGTLLCAGRCQALAEPQCWQRFLNTLRATEWVVHATKPLRHASHVLTYLARYTHRVAISNRRLVALKDGTVTFRWKDYAHGNRLRTRTLDAVEFLRRFVLHILPRGFQRIRHYGFLANRVRQAKLAQCRALFAGSRAPSRSGDDVIREATAPPTPRDTTNLCPACHSGRLVWVQTLRPQWEPLETSSRPLAWDTS